MLGGPLSGKAAAQRLAGPVALDSVTGRSRPEYDATGIALGGLTVRPELAIGLNYDDNIFRTDMPKRSDAYASFRPRVTIATNSEAYPAQVAASATLRRYASIETENSAQYQVAAEAAANLLGDLRLSGEAGYARQLEPRGTAGDLYIGSRPIRYDLASGDLAATRDIGRTTLEIGGSLADYRYRPTTVDGVRLAQDFRDYRQRSVRLRAAYAVSPSIAAFVRGELSRSTYPAERALNRSSTGYSLLGGVTLGLTNLISGSIGIGYLRERFADPAYGDIAGLDYDVALNWSPTPLISVALTGARSLQRSPFIGSAGGISTNVRAGVDYELLRPLILSADLGYTRETYRELARRDRRFEAQLGARYLLSRLIAVTASTNYRRQASSGLSARKFDGFGATLGVTLHR